MSASREYLSLLTKDLERMEVELAAHQRQAELVNARIDELQMAVLGLRMVIRAHGSSPDASPNGWNELPRRQAVAAVLKDAAEPLLPAEIARKLSEHGRKDTPTQVSGALYGLRQVHQAEPMPNAQGWIWLRTTAPDSGEKREDSREEERTLLSEP